MLTRSGLYVQPLVEPRTGWPVTTSFAYASVIDYMAPAWTDATVLVDAEVYRADVTVQRDLSRSVFLLGTASLAGAWGGVFDGFFEWYHGLINYDMPEREARPHNAFGYLLQTPDGRRRVYSGAPVYFDDLQVGLGVRYGRFGQTVLSVTAPTSTGPAGYRRGVPTVNLLNTFRVDFDLPVSVEASVNGGYAPRHGDFQPEQKTLFYALSGGLRIRVLNGASLFGSLFYHSSSFHHTTLRVVDRGELSTDFGLMFRTGKGRDWWIGLNENLVTQDPAPDLVLTFGTRW